MMNRRFYVLVVLSVILFFISCDTTPQQNIIFVDNDTLYYKSSESFGAAALSDLQKYDTTWLGAYDTVTLFSQYDTITAFPATNPFNILIINKNDTIFETIIFGGINSAQLEKVKLLQQFSKFENDSSEKFMPFRYSESHDKNLIHLKEKYKLDEVAGDGNEISKIINLLVWTNKAVRQDGSAKNPTPRNAINIIETCQKENRGVNCRMLATLLNEVYLSMGFKSRHITCMPYDKNDNDCHVINMVYSDSLQKWLYMDPTCAAYFMDKDSTILSIEETRQMLINKEELLLNDEINWNGQEYTGEAYIPYMTKNLFRFISPLSSEFGYESNDDEVVWVYLNPIGYDTDSIGIADTSKASTGIHINYYTSNADYFWALPR